MDTNNFYVETSCSRKENHDLSSQVFSNYTIIKIALDYKLKMDLIQSSYRLQYLYHKPSANSFVKAPSKATNCSQHSLGNST